MVVLATLKQVTEYFGMTSSEFRAALPTLTEADKMDLKTGIGDGSLNY